MAVEKKITYKDQRLTKAQQKKTKPANQGGGPNYLGKQKTVTVPKKWLSSPDHVVAELAYITPREQKILLDADLYGSLKGKPNRGPDGIMSLQGDMGSVGGGPSGNNGGDGNTGRERGANRNRSQTTSKSTTNNKSSNDDGPSYSPHTDTGYTGTTAYGPPAPVDRSAVSQFSTFGRNTMNQNLQGPSALSNITGGIKDYVLGGGLIGMGIRGLGSLFGPSVPSTGNVGPAGIKTDGTYGTIGDAINAGGRNEGYNDYGDGDGLGIMTANILPYQLPGEEVPPTPEEEDFIQRFKVKDQFRKAKGIERLIQDKAIADMISKLYT